MAFKTIKSINNNIFFQRLGLVGASRMLILVSSIILLPILTKTLPIDDYGRWVQFLLVINIIYNLSELGLTTAMLRFIPSENCITKVSEQFHTILATVLTLNILASAVLMFFSQTVANYFFGGATSLVHIIPILLPIIGLNTVCIYYFRARNKIKRHSLFTNLQAYLIVGIVGASVLVGGSLMDAIAGYFFAHLILFWIMFAVIIKEIGISVPTVSYLKEYFKFGLPVVSTSATQHVTGNIDKILIGIFMTMTYIGYYAPAYSIAFALMFLVAPFSTVLPQTLAILYDNGKISEVRNQIKISIKIFLSLAVPIGIMVSLVGKLALEVLTTPEIAVNSYRIVPIFVVCALLYGCQSILSNYLIAVKKPQILLNIGIVTAFTAVISNYILIPQIGLMGAAISMVITYSVQISATAFNVWRIKS